MQLGNSGPYMFTLADAVKLLDSSSGLANHLNKVPSIQDIQARDAILGNYVQSQEQAAGHLERMRTGKHSGDKGEGNVGIEGLVPGKLPSHPTFSSESPYAIKGLAAAEGGNWNKVGDKWNYTPSVQQFNRDPRYMDKLMNYYKHEKGNGIDMITLPDGEVIK